MLPFSFFLALKYLRPKRSFISVVTVISVVGVLLGVAVLVIVLSVMTGFDNMWREKILSFKPHVTITGVYGPIKDDQALCERVEKIPGVTGVAASIETRVLLQAEGRGRGSAPSAPIVLGVSPDRAAQVSQVPQSVKWGSFDLERSHAVIGVDLASQMGLDVGSTILAYSPLNVIREDELYLPEELEVSGVFNMGMRDFDSGFVLTSLEVARELVGLSRGAHRLYVMTEKPFQADVYATRIREELGSDYEVSTWQEIDRVLFNALQHEKSMMFVLLVFITVVAIFCVTNTLIVITVQKTNEIGLLKALGFSAVQIMAAFVWHGWIQCLVGIAAGIGTGLLILVNMPNIVNALTSLNIEVFPKSIYGLSEIPWDTSAAELLQIAFFVMMFCTIASVIPAWLAARKNPAEALRHD